MGEVLEALKKNKFLDKGEQETYIGDGVYASFDGWQIWLRVERDGRNERVALEPQVYHALQAYANTVYNIV